MSDAASWDARYASQDFNFGEAPNRYLESQASRLRAGMQALALGDGEGRNGARLAAQGLDVTAWTGPPGGWRRPPCWRPDEASSCGRP